ncbi:MAG: flagellar hook-length control protein FliK, partial [Burkholderiales bacterium]
AAPDVATAPNVSPKQLGAAAQPATQLDVAAVAGTQRPAIEYSTAAATPVATALPDAALIAATAPTVDVAVLAPTDIAPNPLSNNAVSVIKTGDRPDPVTYQIATPIDSTAWSDSMAHVVRVSLRAGVSEAQLQIEPRDLGPIGLRIRLEGDVAAVSFAASSADTRAILEAQLPRLRESLAASGIELGQTSIEAGSREPNRHGNSAQSPQVRYPNSLSTVDDQQVATVGSTGVLGSRLIDTFA